MSLVPEWWAKYQGLKAGFRKSIDTDVFPLDWFERLLLSGKAQFWSGAGSALVTTVRWDIRGDPYLYTLAATGTLGEVVNSLRVRAEDWAREIGCKYSLVDGRKGWDRVLSAHDYHPSGDSLRKDL